MRPEATEATPSGTRSPGTGPAGRGHATRHGGNSVSHRWSADGRIAKGESNRRAVVEALVGWIDEHGTTPSRQQLADRAGVSVRSVYHHARGSPGLLVAAVALQSERHRGLVFAIPAKGRLETRVGALCRQRRMYFERVTPVFRLAREGARSAGGLEADVDEVLSRDRAALRRQLDRTLAPELLAREERAPILVALLEQSMGWESWRTLRETGGHTEAAAEALLYSTVMSLLS